MKLVKVIVAAIALSTVSKNAVAAIDFNELKFTENSFSFTTNGDFTGLTPPDLVGYRTALSIIFDSSLKNPLSSTEVGYDTAKLNLTASPFIDAKTDPAVGLKWYETIVPDSAYNYVTLLFQNDTNTLMTLEGLQGSGISYTLTFDENTFNTSATGDVSFVWGYAAYKGSIFPSGHYFTEIQTISVVPEPSTLALMLSGLGLIGLVSYRNKRH